MTAKKQMEAQFLRAQRLEGVGALASGIAIGWPAILANQAATQLLGIAR